MRVLVLHSLPNDLVDYASHIDHEKHDVTYLTSPLRRSGVPSGVPHTVALRSPGERSASSVLASLGNSPMPEAIVALSEIDQIPAAELRQALNIEVGLDLNVATLFRDKLLMKTRIAHAGLEVPRFLPLSSTDPRTPSPGWTGRTILKPIDGAGSINTYDCADVQAAIHCFRSMSTNQRFELEEFINLPVLHIDGLAYAGEIVTIQAGRYIGNCLEYSGGAPLGSVQIDTPSVLQTWTQEVLRALGLRDGPFHVEAFSSGDRYIFLEAAARCGSRGTVEAYREATGLNLLGLAAQTGIGEHTASGPLLPGRQDARFGWFLVPGHHLSVERIRVKVPDRLRVHPLVKMWCQISPNATRHSEPSYSYHNVPLGGLLGPGRSDELEDLIRQIFSEAKVNSG